MDQLSPHRCRARQSLQPRAERYRHHPLRYPQHCGPFLPLIEATIQDIQDGAWWRRFRFFAIGTGRRV
nr:hypothetical protein [Ensifer sp. IC4062]